MAEGIRIRPKVESGIPDNALITITDVSRPFREPADGQRLVDIQPVCDFCGVQHFAKTYHLQLRAGTVIVSTTIWERLKAAGDDTFELVNVVSEPPGQLLSPGSNKPVELIEKFAMPLRVNSN